MTQQELQHLYWRAGFGIDPKTQQKLSNTRSNIVKSLFEKSKTVTELKINLAFLEGINPLDLKDNPQLAKSLRDKNRVKILDLNYTWIKRLFKPNELLRERMTLFWANHFVCKDNNVSHALQFNNTLRKHALGDFRDFLKAISKEASMLKYLNVKQNRKAKPNENFARELMELFTLGEGHYTEKDIKESARAFTGYNHDFKGNFILRKFQHDYGLKTFFGKTGNFTGDDIIDIILEKRECAYFISEKVYRYFVNPTPVKSHINEMTDIFYKDYNITDLMEYVFMSDWFYKEQNIGSKIKSPIEYLVGIVNTVPISFEKMKDLIKIQKILGQTLLYPPNVAGWKGDKGWIDANTIMIRLKLPSMLLNNAMISLKEKGDFNDSFRKNFFKRNKSKLPFKTLPDWETFTVNYKTVKNEDLANYIIQGKINKGTAIYLEKLDKKSKRDNCIQLMSLPEYQMC